MVTWEDVAGDEPLCKALEIPTGSIVMHLERVLLADGARLGLESTYLPQSRFGSFSETFDPGTSLYEAIRAAGFTFGSASERIETVLASPREARLLASTTAMPMLLMHRRTLGTEGRPIEKVRSLYRGDRMAFEAVLRDWASS